jgi:Lrp/AsnC family leucine-responsive transcriptional regulator
MSHIDSIDERILGELQANGRLTMKALAERVGLSSPAMIERVRRLEDRGVISGYRAIVTPESLGRAIATVILVRLNGANEDELTEVARGNGAIT